MIEAESLTRTLEKSGFGLFSGTPCSYLTPLTNIAIDSPGLTYVNAANEGEAVAVAAGAELGGIQSGVLFQNSGLGNAVNPLTSLASCFRIPMLLITSWRGQPDGPADEPQHELMGQITPTLLDLMEIPWETFPDEESKLHLALERAQHHMAQHRTPYALIVKKGTVAPRELQSSPKSRSEDRGETLPRFGESVPHEQDDVLRTIQEASGSGDAVVATTGYTGRALYALGDRPSQFYMVGSMGCASSLGLGLALAQPRRRVIVIDGDGAVLMRMGALASLGQVRPKNLVHIVLDNGVHDSTGGQATLASATDFARVAQACGYPRVERVADLEALRGVLTEATEALTFLHVPTLPRRNRKLPRPTVTPAEVADRFRAWLQALV